MVGCVGKRKAACTFHLCLASQVSTVFILKTPKHQAFLHLLWGLWKATLMNPFLRLFDTVDTLVCFKYRLHIAHSFAMQPEFLTSRTKREPVPEVVICPLLLPVGGKQHKRMIDVVVKS